MVYYTEQCTIHVQKCIDKKDPRKIQLPTPHYNGIVRHTMIVRYNSVSSPFLVMLKQPLIVYSIYGEFQPWHWHSLQLHTIRMVWMFPPVLHSLISKCHLPKPIKFQPTVLNECLYPYFIFPWYNYELDDWVVRVHFHDLIFPPSCVLGRISWAVDFPSSSLPPSCVWERETPKGKEGKERERGLNFLLFEETGHASRIMTEERDLLVFLTDLLL